MYIPLKIKLFIPLLLLSIFSVVLIFTIWLPHNHSLLMQDHHKILKVQLENISQAVSGMLLAEDLGAFYSTLDSLSSHNKSWLSLKAYDEKNRLIYPLDAIEVKAKDYLHKKTQVIKYKQQQLGTLEIIADFSVRHKELNEQAYQLLYILLGGIFLIVVVTSVFIEFFVIRPIQKIGVAAKFIMKGRYDTNVQNYSNDEIGKLSERFIKMRESIVYHQDKMKQEFEARQKAQKEIDNQSNQIISILKNSSDSYISIDYEQNILFVNDQAISQFSINESQVTGKNIWDCLPELGSFLYKSVHDVQTKGESIDLEAFYPPSSSWLDVHIFKCNNNISIAVSNITSRKNAEQELYQSERHQRAILDNVADGIVTINSQGKILSFNSAAEKIFGYSESEAKNLSVDSLMEGETAEQQDVFMKKHQKQIGSVIIGVNQELKGKHKNGTLIPIEMNVTRMHLNDEVQLIGIVRDITERKRSEEQLRLAERIFESNNEGIVITNKQTDILRVNKSFLQITGYSEEDVIQKKISMLSSGHHDKDFYKGIWDCLREYGHWKGEIWNKRCTGEIYPEWLSISSVFDSKGEVVNYVGIFSDISDKKEKEERIYKMAHYDELTGLLNRAMFNIELVKATQLANTNSTNLAILYIDLDYFKKINDTFGHPVGDEVLRVTGDRLTNMLRATDKVCRIGGDEFVILISDVAQPDDLSKIANNIIEKLRLPIELEKRELFLGASIGIAMYPQDASSGDDLIRNADAALFMAKNNGRNNCKFYSNEMNAKASERLEIESRLHRALDAQEFVLHYQPQIDLKSKEVIGVEALVRWEHPELGMVPPIEFIPVLEETGMIIPVGEWILFKACLQASSWRDSGLGDIRIAVNISPHQFLYSDIVTTVDDILNITGLPSHLLELEITEGSVMSNTDENILLLKQLSDMGIKLSIDDFGTGYSSLAYLKRLPINTLKIDQSFVRDMHKDVDDENIVRAIISLGKNLDIRVIAEGVEEALHVSKLKDMGCDEIQGYYISRPLVEEKLIDFLNTPADIIRKLN